MDRNHLEQEALALLNRGQVDKALSRYQALLRADPRDRRIRQKVAELLLRLGRRGEGERALREVADGLVTEGQHRAAIAVYKQLSDLNPDDAEIEGLLGTCYHAVGMLSEARKSFEAAIKRLSRVDPTKAVVYARQVVRMSGGETALQVQLAELLESAGLRAEAAETWKVLAAEAKRRGRSADVARFLESALSAAPDDVELLCEAAEARFSSGDPRTALGLIQRAYQVEKQSARVLGLLARAFEEGGMPAKARPVWVQAARLYEAEGQAVARADAIARALACGPDDPELRAQLGEANQAAARVQLRLDDKPWAQPTTEAEVRAVIRARTLARYGFGDRARQVLTETEGAVRSATSVRVALAELLFDISEMAAAASELRAITGLNDEEARDQVRVRMSVISGKGPVELTMDDGTGEPEELSELSELSDLSELQPEALEELQPDGDSESIEDEETDDTPVKPQKAMVNVIKGAVIEELVDDEESPKVIHVKTAKVPAQSLIPEDVVLRARDPLDDVPERTSNAELGALALSLTESPAEFEPSFADNAFVDPFAGGPAPDFSDLLGGPSQTLLEEDPVTDEPTSPGAPIDEGTLAEARGLLAVGLVAEARELVAGKDALGAVVIYARALWAEGELSQACERLRAALADADENDRAYRIALYTLATLDANARRTRSALRLLGELAALDPEFRKDEVADLKRGLEKLPRK